MGSEGPKGRRCRCCCHCIHRADLDVDHYGLEKLKKRVIEYLAVRQIKNTLRGPILCFVGPPGVGKTSVGRSIAKTLGREFHRFVSDFFPFRFNFWISLQALISTLVNCWFMTN